MIHKHLFTLDKLILALLRDNPSNPPDWRWQAEIDPEYVPPGAKPDVMPICVVKLDGNFLRYSKGPRQGHFWDVYPDNYGTSEMAFVALLQAEPPISIIRLKGPLKGTE